MFENVLQTFFAARGYFRLHMIGSREKPSQLRFSGQSFGSGSVRPCRALSIAARM